MTEQRRLAYLAVVRLSDDDSEYPCDWTEKIVVAAASYGEVEAALQAMIQARSGEQIDEISSISIVADAVSGPTGVQL